MGDSSGSGSSGGGGFSSSGGGGFSDGFSSSGMPFSSSDLSGGSIIPTPFTSRLNHHTHNHPIQGGASNGHRINRDLEHGLEREYITLSPEDAPDVPPPAYSPPQPDSVVSGGAGPHHLIVDVGSRPRLTNPKPQPTLIPIHYDAIRRDRRRRRRLRQVICLVILIVLVVIAIVVGVSISMQNKSRLPASSTSTDPTAPSAWTGSTPAPSITSGTLNAEIDEQPGGGETCSANQQQCTSMGYTTPAGPNTWTKPGR